MTPRELQDAVNLLLIMLEILLLGTALWLTAANAVKTVIRAYRIQSYLIALITGLTALNKLVAGKSGSMNLVIQIVSLVLIVLLPLALAILIHGLLARATIVQSQKNWWPSPSDQEAAERIWLKREGKGRPMSVILILGALIAVAAWIAFQAIPSTTQFELPERVGLMISLSLHLIGLYNMVLKSDIISQVIGLLTMDHGLFLAVVKIVAIPVPALFFVVSLYFYTLITLVILVFLVPQMRRMTGSIDLDEIAAGSELEG